MTRSLCSLSSDLRTLTLVLEEDPEHFGDAEDDLPVGDIQEESLLHAFAPFLKAFGMARGEEPPSAAREHHRKCRPDR
jgi:hypothetical protein